MTGTSSLSSGASIGSASVLNSYEPSLFVYCIAVACGIWYTAVILVQIIGSIQLFRHYSASPNPSISSRLQPGEAPHVTVLRPIKGLEPQLYECLAATFRQDYPSDKLTIYFCISSANDPAYSILQRLIDDFPNFDARIFVEEDDPNLTGRGGQSSNLGPNPKIRNLSRGYREAVGDIVWILDCNVWVSRGAAGRMVDRLCGYAPDGSMVTPYKFVHLIPLVVDAVGASTEEAARHLLGPGQEVSSSSTSSYDISTPPSNESIFSQIIRTGGGRFEEAFMATSHAKFYTAINTVSVAPCIVGKSNMFRRSHLNSLTATSTYYSPGIDFFSENICEDHLIGDLLWRKSVPAEQEGQKFGKHGIVFGDMAIQPMAGMSVSEYIARRVRWLRVRKWTVTLATLVEPGVESLLCSAYGAFAITTLPWFHKTFSTRQSWLAFIAVWCLSVSIWITLDWFVYAKLHSCASVELDENTPSFARPPRNSQRRTFKDWLGAWIGRELLALPIWTFACLGGTTVVWRSKTFWVGMDMKVHEIKTDDNLLARSQATTPEVESQRRKDRVD